MMFHSRGAGGLESFRALALFTKLDPVVAAKAVHYEAEKSCGPSYPLSAAISRGPRYIDGHLRTAFVGSGRLRWCGRVTLPCSSRSASGFRRRPELEFPAIPELTCLAARGAYPFMVTAPHARDR